MRLHYLLLCIATMGAKGMQTSETGGLVIGPPEKIFLDPKKLGATPPIPPPRPAADEANAKAFSLYIMGGEPRVTKLNQWFTEMRSSGTYVDVCTFSETTRVEKVLRDVGMIDQIDCIHGRNGAKPSLGNSMWTNTRWQADWIQSVDAPVPPPRSDRPRTKHLILDFDCTLSQEHLWKITHSTSILDGWKTLRTGGVFKQLYTGDHFSQKWAEEKDAFLTSLSTTPLPNLGVQPKETWIRSVIDKQNAEVVFVDDSSSNYDTFPLNQEHFKHYKNDNADAPLPQDGRGLDDKVMAAIDKMFLEPFEYSEDSLASDPGLPPQVPPRANRPNPPTGLLAPDGQDGTMGGTQTWPTPR